MDINSLRRHSDLVYEQADDADYAEMVSKFSALEEIFLDYQRTGSPLVLAAFLMRFDQFVKFKSAMYSRLHAQVPTKP